MILRIGRKSHFSDRIPCIDITDKTNIIKEIRTMSPDVIALDQDYMALAEVINEKIPVIIYADSVNIDLLKFAFLIGVSGFIQSDRFEEDIEKAANAMIRGEIFINYDTGRKVINNVRKYFKKDRDSLSKRENKIQFLINYGFSKEGISSILCLSKKTVRNYFASIKKKQEKISV